MDKITYTPGRLARKLGVSKSKLMNHLRETGLIKECFASKSGRWQIPYGVAARISSVEALATPPPTPVTRSRRKTDDRARQLLSTNQRQDLQRQGVARSYEEEQRSKAIEARLQTKQPDYRQIGKMLRQSGVTLTDLIKYIEQQMEVVHEQSPYNSTQRDESQNPPASGSASADIPNSRAQ